MKTQIARIVDLRILFEPYRRERHFQLLKLKKRYEIGTKLGSFLGSFLSKSEASSESFDGSVCIVCVCICSVRVVSVLSSFIIVVVCVFINGCCCMMLYALKLSLLHSSVFITYTHTHNTNNDIKTHTHTCIYTQHYIYTQDPLTNTNSPNTSSLPLGSECVSKSFYITRFYKI